MKVDLGTQQTEEIQNFYEKFSSQIKGMFQQQENGHPQNVDSSNFHSSS